MKRILLFLTFLSFMSVTIAQDLTSKKGENFLPEQDDWAIGLSATSFLNYAGNLFNAGATAPSAAAPAIPQTFHGKLFTSDKEAYRATIGLNIISSKDNESVTGYETDGTSTGSEVINTTAESETMIMLAFGKEFRRGSTRLQGFYGAEAFVLLGGGSTSYTYGNTVKSEANAGVGNVRVLDVNDGGLFGLGLRSFVGAEYFIAPKISISAEYGWGLGFSSQGGGESVTETYDFADDSVDTETTSSPSDSNFSIANDMGVASGTLGLTLHF